MDLKRKFEANEFAVLAEMEPPKGANAGMMIACAKKVKDRIDAFVVPEMSNAVMRMSSLGGAMVLQKEGLPTVFQICCRDRNRLALQADLLAASALGIKNVMAVSGEDPSFGDHHQARSVYDIDLIELLSTVQQLQAGRDMAGIELAGAPEFLVGSTAGAGARGKSPEVELEEMMKRAEAGARFFITPPLFDIADIEPFLKRIDRTQVFRRAHRAAAQVPGDGALHRPEHAAHPHSGYHYRADPACPGQGARVHPGCGRDGFHSQTGRIQRGSFVHHRMGAQAS